MSITTKELISDLAIKATDITQNILLSIESHDVDQVLIHLESRDRVISIIESLNERLNLEQKNSMTVQDTQFNVILSDLISYINEYNDLILDFLNKEKLKAKNQIAKTFKNKENFKGYNLNTLK